MLQNKNEPYPYSEPHGPQGEVAGEIWGSGNRGHASFASIRLLTKGAFPSAHTLGPPGRATNMVHGC